MANRPARKPVEHLNARFESSALGLRLHPDPLLRAVCCPVEEFGSWLSGLFDEMLILMRAHNGIGLAAPQVGITRRLFVAEIDGHSVCLANPVLVSCYGSEHMAEGCLSLPGACVEVERNHQVEVQGYDSRGGKQLHRVQGLWARVMQHEIDHLDGMLISDYRKPCGETGRQVDKTE
jgi:peptide deformylase